MIWLNTTSGEVKLRSGGATVTLATGALGVSDGDKGDITVSAAGGVWTIDAGAVSNGKLAAMPSGTFKARSSAGAGAPEDITAAAAAEMLPVVTPSAKGLAPASGGGNTNFLRADGVWAAPPSGSGGTLAGLGLTANAAQINRVAGMPPPPVGAVLAGDPSWNRALGVNDPAGPLWPQTWVSQSCTWERVGTGVEDGLPYIDYRISGTPTATYVWLNRDGAAGPAAVEGQRWTFSYTARRIAGGTGGHFGLYAGCDAFNLNTYLAPIDRSPVSDLEPRTQNTTDTLLTVSATNPANTTRTIGRIWLHGIVGQPIDVTYRIKGVQLEQSPTRTEGRMIYVQNALIPAGQVAHFAMNTAPAGWLKANGALVSRATFAELFAAIGTTFGAGDGATTFQLPDLRGEFLRGWDDGRGVDAGRAFGAAQGGLVGPHGHDLRTGSGTGAAVGGWPLGRASSGLAPASSPRFVGAIASADMTTTETRPRNVALLACIKF